MVRVVLVRIQVGLSLLLGSHLCTFVRLLVVLTTRLASCSTTARIVATFVVGLSGSGTTVTRRFTILLFLRLLSSLFRRRIVTHYGRVTEAHH